MPKEQGAHFGYRRVSAKQKTRLVGKVFDSVAERYDLMNDLMSLGIHRLWKRAALEFSAVRPGNRVLDLAGGTGDLAALFASRVRPGGRVVVADFNEKMLRRGRDRLCNRGVGAELFFVCANGERLPFADGGFDLLSIAFGLRNITDKAAALAEMRRVLRPGGRFLILEFSRPALPLLERLYDAWSFAVLPRLGKWVVGDADSYRYLVESIRMHPAQEELQQMALDAGFSSCRYCNLSGGIVAVHYGVR